MSDVSSTCSLPNCDKPLKRAGYCYGHYMQNWRYGTPTPVFPPRWKDLRGRRFGLLVVTDRADTLWLCVCDCGSSTVARAGDLNRGTVSTCGDKAAHWRRDDIGYSTAHDRCRADRGKVQQYPCVDCGRPAEHWSYNHTDPDELLTYELSANAVAYSADPAHYSPRCIKCHKRFDLGRIHAMAEQLRLIG